MQPLKVKFSRESKDGSRTKVNERNVGSEGTNLRVNRQRMNSSHIAKSYTTRSMLKQESRSYVGHRETERGLVFRFYDAGQWKKRVCI